MTTRLAASLFLALTLTGVGSTGCGPATLDDPAQPDVPDVAPDPDLDTTGAIALIEVYALDLWGQYLPPSIAQLHVSRESGDDVSMAGFPVAHIVVGEPGSFRVSLTADAHQPIDLTVDVGDRASLRNISDGGGAVAVSRGERVLNPEQEPTPVTTIYLGLRHKWFSAQARPARRGNQVELLMDGEQAWSRVYSALDQAQNTIDVSTWWWESDFELLRDANNHWNQSEDQRRPNTIMSILDRSAAYKRVLVGQFLGQDGLLSWMTVDSELERRGAETGDRFEFMGQANPTHGVFAFDPAAFSFNERVRVYHGETRSRGFDSEVIVESQLPEHNVDLTQWPVGVDVDHASWHQKFLVVDDRVAFVGGMNFRRVDWDTSRHRVFEPRRMLFDASASDRMDVLNGDRLPDTGPRKDYIARIAGPSAHDVADVFKRRWDTVMADGVTYSNNASGFSLGDPGAELDGGVQAQITTTMPEPYWEHGIAESWLNAIGQAQRYIYIEDQYFRAPMLNDAIEERMRQVPGLRLIVITKPINEWLDPGCAWTYRAHERFKSQFPNRYQLFQLRAFATQVTWGWDETEARFVDMDVHSKLLIVDDVFASVGSANKNNRGMIYEGEINVAVFDAAWVRAARRRVLANLLPPGTVVSDDVTTWTAQLAGAASYNDQIRNNWADEGDDISLDGAPLPTSYTPRGFLYGMDFPDVSECLLESVGPDMT